MKSNTGLRAAETTAPILESDGDILKPLRAIRDKYIARAKYLAALEVRPHGDGMYYENAALNVGALLAERPTAEARLQIYVDGLQRGELTVSDVRYAEGLSPLDMVEMTQAVSALSDSFEAVGKASITAGEAFTELTKELEATGLPEEEPENADGRKAVS